MQNSWINAGDKAHNFNTIEEIRPDRCRSIDLYNTPFVSPVNVSSINRSNVHEVDKFYKIVQLHREQYKNPTDKSHPMKYFKLSDNSSGPTNSYFSKYPVTYVKYKTPLVLPRTYSRELQLPLLPDRKNHAKYHRGNCIAFKR